MPNRLSKETSPYLLQHQDNPVDWYPWGPEALARAKSENKPILLSVGYSACHWCHVMAHESFENPDIAALMNEHFVNIKVDREERPDLDQIYQNVAQAMTHSGGWPLTVFLTPDLKPFFGGTYFPPEDKYGRPGFPRVLAALTEAYKNSFSTVSENAEKLTEYIFASDLKEGAGKTKIALNDFDRIAEGLLSRFDWENGGFGGAPKFPNPMLLSFLWRYGVSKDHKKAKDAVIFSLTQMASGGIYDQLGGGFHRYSVDVSWSVPHFEKMLYDNGLLLKLFSEVVLTEPDAAGADFFLQVIRETSQYVLREMVSSEGVFFSAQDADSEGEEGKFFVWDPQELKMILNEPEFHLFCSKYGVTEAGNFEHGKTVLYLARPFTPGELKDETLQSARKKAFETRELRVHPGLDDKALASWNGLMISGLVWASQALLLNGETQLATQLKNTAQRAFEVLNTTLRKEGNRLYSTLQKGEPKLNAYLDDYAFLARAGLDLSRFSGSAEEIRRFLDTSLGWINVVLEKFKDPVNAGFFFTSDDHETLIQRPKTFHDQAIPSGMAVVLECMSSLSALDWKSCASKFESVVTDELESLFSMLQRNYFGMGALLETAFMEILGPVTIEGEQAPSWITHPHFFQKPSEKHMGSQKSKKQVVCHKKTCFEEEGTGEDLKRFFIQNG